MGERIFSELQDRGLLTVAGEDRRSFLQGLVSNDVEKASPRRAIHAALLTPQGKYLHDFCIVEIGETLCLEGERERLSDLKRRLSIYRLRAKVTLQEAPDWAVAVAWGDGAAASLGLRDEPGAAAPFADGAAFVDPRLAELGVRVVAPAAWLAEALGAAGFTAGAAADWDRRRLELGVPDGSRDLPIEKAILLESGFDELNGVDWQKGCYVGQELTARTKYRGLVKKRLMPVHLDRPAPPAGTPVTLGDKEAGELRSSQGDVALALLRLETVAEAAQSGETLRAGAARLTPIRPDWARF
jgi:tRNA-modifying protein YgfZ